MRRRPSWLNSLLGNRRSDPIRKNPQHRRNRLGIEEMESRIVPDSRTLGGLVFDADGTFGGNSVAGVVRVRVANIANPEVLHLNSGVTLNSGNNTFTTSGSISSVTTAGNYTSILGAASRTFSLAEFDGIANAGAGGSTVTGGVAATVQGVSFTASSLKVTGTAASPTLQMRGSVRFPSVDSRLNFDLGQTASVVSNSGGLRFGGAFSITLPSKTFEVKKLEIKTEGVTVAYDGTSRYSFDGNITIKSQPDKNDDDEDKAFNGAKAEFGAGSRHGMVFNNGQLESLYVVVNAKFPLFGVQVQADNLVIDYDSAASALRMSGGVEVELTEKIGFKAALNKPIQINPTTGAISFPDGFDMSGGLKLGGFDVDAHVSYDATPGGYVLRAGGTVHLTKYDISGSFTIVNGRLTQVGLAYDVPPDVPNQPPNLGIPIGNTGLYLTHLGGGVENLDDPANIIFTADMNVVFGKKITIGSTEYAVFDLHGSVTITPSSFHLDGSANLVGGILGSGSASVDINWSTGEYKLHVNARMLQIFTFNGDLAFDNSGNITLNATAAVSFPDSVPFVGGVSIASATVYMQIRPSGGPSQNYVAAWTSLDFGYLGSATIGFKKEFGGSFSLLTAPDKPDSSDGGLGFVFNPDFRFQKFRNFALDAEPGIESYRITVTHPSFANPATRNNYYLVVTDSDGFNPILFPNQQSTQNTGGQGNFAGTENYAYSVFPGSNVPQEPDQVGQPGAAANQRVFVLPRKYFATNPATGGTRAGTLVVAMLGRQEWTTSPTFAITPVYRPATVSVSSVSLNSSTGVTTINLTGTSFGPSAASNLVDVYRTNPRNPFAGVLVKAGVPIANLNAATGAFSMSTTWNGLSDLWAGADTPSYAFYARIHDGASSLRTPFEPTSTALRPINPEAVLAPVNPSGMTPDLFDPQPFIQAATNSNVPGGYFVNFRTTLPHFSVSGALPLSTTLTLRVDQGGNIGFGTAANVAAGGLTQIASPTFASPAAAMAWLYPSQQSLGLKFTAGADFTGRSTITITAKTTTLTGETFTTSLDLLILREPIFLLPYVSYPATGLTESIYGRVDTSFDYQFTFANGFDGVPFADAQHPYRFRVVEGELPAGLTLSDTGLLSGTPTASTLPADSITPEYFTIAAYDSLGSVSTHRYPIVIIPGPQNAFQPVEDFATMTQATDHIYINVIANDGIPAAYVSGASLISYDRAALNADPHVDATHPLPAHGRASGFGVNMIYIVDDGFIGTDTFYYKIREDPFSTPVKVTVTVGPMVVDLVSDEYDVANNPGHLTLRQAVLRANAVPGPQSIAFDPTVFNFPQTIRLERWGPQLLPSSAAMTISGDVTIIGPGAELLTIDGNGANGWGGFLVNPGSNVTVSGMTITNGLRLPDVNPNTPGSNTYYTGGGVYNGGTLLLRDVYVTGNTTIRGGGVYNDGTLTIENSTIARNVATGFESGGGGVVNNIGTMTILNSTISSNTAGTFAGGIANFADLTVRNSTIAFNRSDIDNNRGEFDYGGGILTNMDPGTQTLLQNTLVIGNTTHAREFLVSDDLNGANVSAASSFNLIGSTAGGLVNGSQGNIVGRSAGTVLDLALRVNGGSTPTHALVAGGPAVDAGSNALVPNGATTDQQGLQRIRGSAVDIGATEGGVLPPVVTEPGALPAALLVTGPATGLGKLFSPTQGLYNGGFGQSLMPGFAGEIRVALADVNKDGILDQIAGAGPGGDRVRVVDGATGAILADFLAFGGFAGGVHVAAGDLNGDGFADLAITGDSADAFSGPVPNGLQVRVFSGASMSAGTGNPVKLADFNGLASLNGANGEGPLVRLGGRPAIADVNGDGVPDLLVAAGSGGGPRVCVWNGTGFASANGGTPTVNPIANLFVFESTQRGGAFLTAGDVTGDHKAEIAVGGGPGGGPRLRIVNAALLLSLPNLESVNLDDPVNLANGLVLNNFFAGDGNSRGGVRLTARDVNGDGKADIVTGSGTGEHSQVRVYDSSSLAAAFGSSNEPADPQVLDPFGMVLPGGIWLG